MKNQLNCILLVDDDEPTNFLNRLILEEAACAKNIRVAQSGQAALQYLSAKQKNECGCEPDNCPELIFLDINMPAMNGWEFLERYAKLDPKQKANVVVVMLTTSLNPDDAERAKQISDVSAFETKPLTPEKIGRILKMYFPQE